LVVGEVLWDVFPDSTRLGGAPLNFAAHVTRLGHEALLISAVGADEPGRQARQQIEALGLDTSLLQTASRFGTGTAGVELGPDGRTSFVIRRPAAYDEVNLSESHICRLKNWNPGWIYYGTLFPALEPGRDILFRLLGAFPETLRFYDVNLRPGFDSASLVLELLARASVVKLNDEELRTVHEFTGLPSGLREFCFSGTQRYGWKAVSVTLGSRGCAVLSGGEYVECPGIPIRAADPVGAGDAFAAALMHGLSQSWPARRIAPFANKIGALVASRPGAIPDWTLADAAALV
jgi:fructokinase